jgi:hypothetical protein
MASGKSAFANLHFEGLHLQDWHEIDICFVKITVKTTNKMYKLRFSKY